MKKNNERRKKWNNIAINQKILIAKKKFNRIRRERKREHLISWGKELDESVSRKLNIK